MPPNFGKRTYSLSFSEYLLCILGFPVSSVGKESACNTGDPGSIPGLGRFFGEGIGYPLHSSWASLVAQLVKNLPAMWETWVRSLGWEDPLEKGKATHSSILGVTKSWTRLSNVHFHFHSPGERVPGSQRAAVSAAEACPLS